MKKLLFILVIYLFYSCGETEYQKKLKADIYRISLEISVDSAKYAKLEEELHSNMINLEKSNPVVMQHVLNEQDKLRREMKVKKDKKDMLELELAKTK